ncbi:hypothetical protein BDQ17DRAFT_1081820 [Cyathus striatus]|nr:hypothetical protein BDQ17DRAFT_1081820 [Cyathus striatus]
MCGDGILYPVTCSFALCPLRIVDRAHGVRLGARLEPFGTCSHFAAGMCVVGTEARFFHSCRYCFTRDWYHRSVSAGMESHHSEACLREHIRARPGTALFLDDRGVVGSVSGTFGTYSDFTAGMCVAGRYQSQEVLPLPQPQLVLPPKCEYQGIIQRLRRYGQGCSYVNDQGACWYLSRRLLP